MLHPSRFSFRVLHVHTLVLGASRGVRRGTLRPPRPSDHQSRRTASNPNRTNGLQGVERHDAVVHIVLVAVGRNRLKLLQVVVSVAQVAAGRQSSGRLGLGEPSALVHTGPVTTAAATPC